MQDFKRPRNLQGCHGLLPVRPPGKELPPSLQYASLVAWAFVLMFNQMAGRPGEWTLMLRETMEDVLRRGAWFVVCTKHKTSRWLGELGKYLAPGTLHALKVFLALPSRGERLLEPTKAMAKHVQVASLLKRACAEYLQLAGHEYYCPTFLRKFYVDKLEVDEDKEVGGKPASPQRNNNASEPAQARRHTHTRASARAGCELVLRVKLLLFA